MEMLPFPYVATTFEGDPGLVHGAADDPDDSEPEPMVLIARTFTVYEVPFEIAVPEPGEYVALGAARQAAWALSQSPTPPNWNVSNFKIIEKKASSPELYAQYQQLILG